MAEFREMAWTCPRCSTENRGPVRNCERCGAPQPEDVKFHQKAGAQIVTDSQAIAAASKGPDVHCGFCGTRNPADATLCSQCGADLDGAVSRGSARLPERRYDPSIPSYQFDFEGWKDESGSPSVAKVRRPAKRQNPFAFLGEYLPQIGIGMTAVLAVVLIAWIVWMTFFNVTNETVVIQGFSWSTTQVVEKYDWVKKFDQPNEPPSSARSIVRHLETTGYGQKDSCTDAGKKDVPTGKMYVCGEGWENQENGYEKKVPTMCPETEKVQVTACTKVDDLSKPTQEPRWDYEIQEWIFDFSLTNTGTNQTPVWPKPELGINQQYGLQSQQFIVTFIDKKEETHTDTKTWMSDLPWFQSLKVGQYCTAERNGFGLLNPGIDCSVLP